MSEPEHFDVVILGSGQGGKALAWRLGKSGKKVAVVERRWVGGSCPAVACMPSKNELWSARVAHIVRHAADFGTLTSVAKTDSKSFINSSFLYRCKVRRLRSSAAAVQQKMPANFLTTL